MPFSLEFRARRCILNNKGAYSRWTYKNTMDQDITRRRDRLGIGSSRTSRHSASRFVSKEFHG